MDIGGAELVGNMWLAGGGASRAQRRRVDVGAAELAGNTGLSARQRARSSAAARSLPVTRRGQVGYGRDTRGGGGVAALVRDTEEMHKLHNIIPLPVALN